MKTQTAKKELMKKLRSSIGSFTWKLDLVESIWGYKGSPTKSFTYAIRIVEKFIDENLENGNLSYQYDGNALDVNSAEFG